MTNGGKNKIVVVKCTKYVQIQHVWRDVRNGKMRAKSLLLDVWPRLQKR